MSGHERALTVSEAAARLGVSVASIRRWSDAGLLPSFRTPGGQRRFDADRLDAFRATLERAG